MVNRLEMAKLFVQEQLEKRDDIVGAFVVGSVARGEDTEASDIDLRIGTNAREIRRGSRDVILENGAALPYERLLISTGAVPRRLNR